MGEVLVIGHTSGADLLGGLAGCLDALSSPDVATAPRVAPPILTSTRVTSRSLS